ncbi:choline dehydrogenase [Minwuia thermotolerans]|uniref:Oxygen-dependent choline dehydrogenase n=1 Tax=Minwuia thermotolerans TaxID=2056226 RepID=A0A2M9G5E0_9PROT|nr:choline dehydrogenase [Minwuia thermotolerans]PJK30933.1 choline dehydrogenase [Minwuia thermotolerans]
MTDDASVLAEADYVIVGSGSAGSALAARLSESGRHSVIVLEHGGSDAGPFIQMPAALSYPMNMARYDWGYVTEPEPHLGGRRLACPRGKVIGGSSSINGMVYVRGHAQDYEGWAQAGARGWAWRDVVPYFRRMETSHGGEAGWRGEDGPLHVSRGPMTNPLYRAFIEAGREAGYETTDDYNGRKQEGFGPMEMTVWRGRRWSAANAYLKPALKRRNLRLIRCLVERVVFDGRKAVGVRVRQTGRPRTVRARREVILAASSINSPKLLMLSGIGPAAHLQEHGIEVLADRPGVGGNLQDHLEIYIQKICKEPVSLYPSLNLAAKAWIGARWLFTKTGLGATNHFEAAAFIRSRAGIEYPDIQYHFLPVAIRYDGKAPAKSHGFQVHVGPMRSPSRGRVRLAAPDPAAAPSIQFNYMSNEKDWADFRTCIRLSREIFAQPAFERFAGPEIAPGDEVTTDEALDDFIRGAVESAYHPCGTCRMGDPDDAEAVVDPEGRVIGADGLRVADSSVFPRITNGNLNGPSIMVGEKMADHILGRDLLPPDDREPWLHPDWEARQR